MMRMRGMLLGAVLTIVGVVGAGRAQESGRAKITIDGNFDNAQVTGVRVEGAADPEPRVVIGGALDVAGMPERARDPNRFLYWHFRLGNCQDRTLRFELYYAKASLWPLQTLVPVVRYADGQVEFVHGIEVKSYGLAAPGSKAEKAGVFFRHRFRSSPAFISYTLPFTNDDISALAEELQANPAVQIHALGKTPLFGKPLYQFVVIDPKVPDQNKKGVWLYGGEDPWEMPGVYGSVGFLKFVASEDPLARAFRQKFVLSVIPHVNPDALHRGDTNFYLDEKGRDIMNTALSWGRTDVAAHELTKAALRKWKSDGRTLDFSTTMHSSCFWAAVMRTDWAYDRAVAQQFIDEVYTKKYIPWAAGKSMATPADLSGTLVGQVASKLWPDRVLHFGQHLEQIVLSKRELLGLGPVKWPEELPGDFLRCQKEDLYQQGALFARAVAEFYGVKVDPKEVPPVLMCGEVSRYWGAVGEARTYSVLYRDLEGREAKSVKLTVRGQTMEMKRAAGVDAVRGFLFTASVPLEPGKNDFHFEASNGVLTIRYPQAGELLGGYAVGN